MIESICGYLKSDKAELLRQNFIAVERDPVTVAAVAAMGHLNDKFFWGVLTATCWSEIMGAYAAQIACAVSGRYRFMDEYRQRLAPVRTHADNPAFVELVCRAMALGFEDKW